MPLFTVENIDDNPDGSRTFYGTSPAGELVVVTLPPGAPVALAICSACKTPLKDNHCPRCEPT